MISGLFISSDLNFSAEFESVFTQSLDFKDSIRAKYCISLVEARKWLDLSTYDLIVFDHSLDERELIGFLLDCWSLSKPPICSYFSRISPSSKMRSLFVIGVEDCSGVQCYQKLKSLIEKVPRVLQLLNTTHTSVMVIEDLDSPRDIICTLIQSLGYSNVIGVSRVEEAISKLKDSPFDYFAIISDINMPHRSGFSFVKEVRSTLSLSYLPIIILTSDPSEENLIEALKCGVTSFMAKPPKKTFLKAELDKAKRIVTLGKDPQVGTLEEIRMLEKEIRNKKV